MRTALKDIGQNGSHAGLILARYLPFATTKEEKDNQKRTVMTYAIDAVKHSHDTHDIYQSAFDRWKAALKAGKIEAKEFTVDSRMIIGLGSSNVLEAGITLHQTYGVPYIPGSALKGLTAHYAYENGVSDEHRKWIFGEQDFAGLVQFHDAWLEPKDVKDCLLQDVMTPHHQDYYGQDKDGNIPPSEFESPVPVPFLAVQGTFCVALSCEDNSEQGKKWLKFVWQLLGGA
ncbi:MAG: type III-B CRISPR module RAMP protein Cmr6, partial [Planctomycetaceae bacterium]|nr:type III-B CRISPR module RAMP protein Cmr6 [Planctomycetaceae bacterium]